jgi:hypothetical protein
VRDLNKDLHKLGIFSKGFLKELTKSFNKNMRLIYLNICNSFVLKNLTSCIL